MSIRKFAAATFAAFAATCVAAVGDAQVTAPAALQSAAAAELGPDGVPAQIRTQKTQAAADKIAFHVDDAAFHGGGDHGGDWTGPRPGPRPGPWNGPRPGRRDWNRWPGHPGWGNENRWNFSGGHWRWWGWAPWAIGAGVACDAYYANSYQACANAAWVSNSYCVQSCQDTGDPACGAACTAETQDAVNTCASSYESEWSCGAPAPWPPVGIAIP